MFVLAIALLLNFALYYAYFLLPIIPWWGTALAWYYFVMLGLGVAGSALTIFNADAAYSMRKTLRSRESAVMNYFNTLPMILLGIMFFHLGWTLAVVAAIIVVLTNFYWIPKAWSLEFIAEDTVREVLGKK